MAVGIATSRIARAPRGRRATDYVAVPGGIEPMTLSVSVPEDFNFFRRRITSVIEAHGTRAHRRDRAPGLRVVPRPAPRVVGDRSKRSTDCRFAARGVVAAQDVCGRQGGNLFRAIERGGSKKGALRDCLTVSLRQGPAKSGKVWRTTSIWAVNRRVAGLPAVAAAKVGSNPVRADALSCPSRQRSWPGKIVETPRARC